MESISLPSVSSKAPGSEVPSLCLVLQALTVLWTSPNSNDNWISHVPKGTFSTCRSHYPAGRGRSPAVNPTTHWPSPIQGRVGSQNFTFEACRGFNLVAAHRFAGPPEVDFCPRGFRRSVTLTPSRVATEPSWRFLGQNFHLLVPFSIVARPELIGFYTLAAESKVILPK